jgi:hypothetical protein
MDAFAYQSHMYQCIFEKLFSTLTDDWDSIELYRWFCRYKQAWKPSPIHAIDLDRISLKTPVTDHGISAIFVTPQSERNPNTKILLIIVLESLSFESSINLFGLVDEVLSQLKAQGVSSSEVEINLVDRFGFLCFSVSRQFGLKSKCLYKRYAEYKPCLYSLIFNDSIEHDRALNIMAGFLNKDT